MPKFNWKGRELTVKQGRYQYGSCNQLAILCFDDADPECSSAIGIPYGVLTVNLDDPRCEPWDDDEYAMQYLDVNNWPGIEQVLAGCEWAQPTEAKQQSGFVTYPIWMFKVDEIPFA